jgi:hypothetical protein
MPAYFAAAAVVMKDKFYNLGGQGYSKEWRLKLHIRLDHDNNPSQTYDCEEVSLL